MNVNFLMCLSDHREKDKSYKVIKTLECKIKSPCSLYKPKLIVKKDLLGDISNVNYCYIADFKRYYFVNDCVLENGGIVEIELECDVLLSFKDGINGIKTLVTRQENVFDMEIIDNDMLVQNKRVVQHKNFSNSPFSTSVISGDSDCMVINVSGGGE